MSVQRDSMVRQRLERLIRAARYRTPLRRAADRVQARLRGSTGMGREGWNAALEGDFSFYHGGNLFTDLRNEIITALLRHHAPEATSALDVGCASGSLAPCLARIGITEYVGSDISDAAIAKADPSLGTFVAADMREFEPPNGERFDVMVFNEVLYYIGVDEALAETERYLAWLNPGGVICIAMTDDPKAHAITALLAKRLRWVDGALYQEKHDGPSFSLRRVNPRPHLVGVLTRRDPA